MDYDWACLVSKFYQELNEYLHELMNICTFEYLMNVCTFCLLHTLCCFYDMILNIVIFVNFLLSNFALLFTVFTYICMSLLSKSSRLQYQTKFIIVVTVKFYINVWLFVMLLGWAVVNIANCYSDSFHCLSLHEFL